METLLNVEGINVYYGAIHAIKDISFHVNEGEIVTLIGANGAGKTTTLQTISGLLRSKTGSITFEGQNISNVRADKLVAIAEQPVEELGTGMKRETHMTDQPLLLAFLCKPPDVVSVVTRGGGTHERVQQVVVEVARAGPFEAGLQLLSGGRGGGVWAGA